MRRLDRDIKVGSTIVEYDGRDKNFYQVIVLHDSFIDINKTLFALLDLSLGILEFTAYSLEELINMMDNCEHRFKNWEKVYLAPLPWNALYSGIIEI